MVVKLLAVQFKKKKIAWYQSQTFWSKIILIKSPLHTHILILDKLKMRHVWRRTCVSGVAGAGKSFSFAIVLIFHTWGKQFSAKTVKRSIDSHIDIMPATLIHDLYCSFNTHIDTILKCIFFSDKAVLWIGEKILKCFARMNLLNKLLFNVPLIFHIRS